MLSQRDMNNALDIPLMYVSVTVTLPDVEVREPTPQTALTEIAKEISNG
jgi:hypothetical protein